MRSVGCWPDPCMWLLSWPPDDWCCWPSTGCCFAVVAPLGNSDHWPNGYVSSFSDEYCWCIRLRVVFSRLLRLGSFSSCWRQANVTPIPKDPSTSSVANYQLIYMTPVLSKVFSVWSLCNSVVCIQPHIILIRTLWVLLIHFFVCHIQWKVY